MDATMNVKITDLGFAVRLGENEALTDLFGTPGKLNKWLRTTTSERLSSLRLHGT
jgi:hypothetical protein